MIEHFFAFTTPSFSKYVFPVFPIECFLDTLLLCIIELPRFDYKIPELDYI